ncbi:zinc ABC transporter substrate-binding protein AdcA [Enterococcus ureasiticus]|uniref:Zinc-binding protein n=1 Tax=Enterococcus ureasiticus TaxID=903984 RepID=A0A1E5GCE7_9ENTE|nr:zinc ABC transporter substrate-binding protein AdcA [Enterococcus ureasiticus]OEG10378.1 zinc-binding protein [Enterococcus ureasiticus]
MKKKLTLIITGLFLLTVILTACTKPKTEIKNKDKKKLTIVTSFYPMYEFTRNIVGDSGDVTSMVPAGTEAHDYEPSAKDIANLQDADAFVYNSEYMETWVPKMEKSLKNVTSIKASEGMVLLPGGKDHDHSAEKNHDGHSHDYDPHLWLSPFRAIKEVETIRDGLIKQFPEQKKIFTKNAAAYIKQLTELDSLYKSKLLNAKQKNFITQHTAFSYLALDYNLKQVPIAGISPDQEPKPSRIAELKKLVEETGINYIYFEENANDRVAKTLANEAGVELLVLNPLEGLTKEDTKAGKTYISVMKENLEALIKSTDVTPKKEVAEPTVNKTISNGYFDDKDVKDRDLSDYAGEWQSVFPYLEEGTFDQVFDYKEKLTKKMTAEEYKDYYQKGYQTDVDRIDISKDSMIFIVGDKKYSSKYKYVGKEILTYKAGNRGVRFLFEATEDTPYKYVQFSDHRIAPSKAAHFHIYFGNESQQKLLEEMDNWPTYYPVGMTGFDIAQEMLAH